MKIYLRLLFVLSVSLLYGRQQSMAVRVVVDKVNYEINSDNTATCEGSTSGSTFVIENLIIPDYITYLDKQYPVTSIKNFAFYSNNISLLKGSLTIGNNVISIGSYAFASCSGLRSIIIGDSVTSIGSYAFTHCSMVNSLMLGPSVTYIGTEAFYACNELTGVYITDWNPGVKLILPTRIHNH